MEKSNIELAGHYIFQSGLLSKWGTGVNAVSTDVALYQQKFVISKFYLDYDSFSKAMRYAESLANQLQQNIQPNNSHA